MSERKVDREALHLQVRNQLTGAEDDVRAESLRTIGSIASTRRRNDVDGTPPTISSGSCRRKVNDFAFIIAIYAYFFISSLRLANTASSL
jgi:hypothetical protein